MNTPSFNLSLLLGSVLAAGLAACSGGGGTGESGLTREDLGQVTTDTGGNADIQFTPADGAVSALVTCGPYGYDVLATAQTITDPNAGIAYDYNTPEGTPMRVSTTDDLLPVLIPVSPDLDIVPGQYDIQLLLDAAQPTTVTCSALYRTEAASASQTVDIHFVFVGVDGDVPDLNGTAAVDHQLLNDTLTRVGELWSGLGLSVGTVTYEDFSGDVSTYNSVDGDQEFGDLLRTNTSTDRTMTIFMVSAITSSDGASILGMAAGPPGAPATGGTSKSGAVVTVSSLVDGDTDTEARIIAHEVGHFMGLFHTTEKDGSSHDPLSDTPECTNDSDGNGTYSTEECSGQGAENLMWWAASTNAATTSENQAWVVQRSALPQ